jgi:hypothetical protein
MIPFRTYDTYQPFGPLKVPSTTLRRRTLTGPFGRYGRQPAMSVRPQNGEFSYVALIADYIAVKTEAYRSVVDLANIYADRARRDRSPCAKSGDELRALMLKRIHQKLTDIDRAWSSSPPPYGNLVSVPQFLHVYRRSAARKRDLG